MKAIFITIFLFFNTCIFGQKQLNVGLVSKVIPEIHLGLYSNIIFQPFDNKLSFIVGIDGYHKFTNGSFGIFDLGKNQYKRHYNVVAQTYLGIGLFSAGSNDIFGIYPTFTYHLHSFKESINNDFVNQTIQQTNFGWNLGLLSTWTRERFNFQLQIPLPFFYKYADFNWRYVNMKFGISLGKTHKDRSNSKI